MKLLSELLQGFDYSIASGTIDDADISAVAYDSRKACSGGLFVCIKGAAFDGHEFAEEVALKGVRAIVAERPLNLPKRDDLTVILVEDSRYALAFISAAWFDHPAESLKVIGITGTKGKTTSTYLVKSMLEKAGHKVGLIGTIETVIGDEHRPAKNTTPESYLLQETFAEMRERGMDSVVMEVSSQALMLHRTQGFIFDYGVFTNIEPDHIGPNEHKDFEDYLSCKGRLFRQCRVGIVNGDDKHTLKLLMGHSCALESFGMGDENDIHASDVHLIKTPGALGVGFDIHGKLEMKNVEVSAPGQFSVYNALCAIAIAKDFGVPTDIMRESLKGVHVRGRIEAVKVSDEFSLMIDYAHNAMALKSLLTSLREYEPGRLVCVFGCGGNRSRERRFEMGEVSGQLADFTIITSDNPRFEDPKAIMEDIETGIKKTAGEYIMIEDRKEAIAYAIHNGRPGDVIVLAGKGHEDYQEIKGVKHDMDERVLIKEILEGK